ncbi:BET1P/SFT1P-like protein 14A [Prunus dulcis]|uniref:BET1P/SFT1P-like protein 14A n=1 Tax=Prunus dulcis TaxID=3755 RepID=A0A4Y1S0F9_PRUDU|nr:BET1P/SFT1P-like protein 14A [Prunus dulcis]
MPNFIHPIGVHRRKTFFPREISPSEYKSRRLTLVSPLSYSAGKTPRLPSKRDYRGNKVALFDGIEEGGIRASASYSHEIDEHDNERAVDGLQDRVNLLKRLSGDIHEEVESHNHMLDRMGNDMDSSRGVLSGTMDKFKMVFETKSSQRMFTLVASFVVIFLVIYYLTRGVKCLNRLINPHPKPKPSQRGKRSL